MKYRLFNFLTLILALVIGSSCSTKEPVSPQNTDGPVAVQVRAGIDTRAHDNVWDDNDAIGLAMLTDNGQEVINNIYNYHYINATSGVFEPRNGNNTIYFPQDGTNVSFRAYYPFFASLDTDMVVPVSTVDQTSLPRIDFMTAEHVSGYSKAQPTVHLTFHHRLSKLIFIFEEGDDFVDYNDLTLEVKGMRTTGEYELIAEQLDVDEDSYVDMTFPKRDDPAERYGIVMPRSAGEGVSFVFTDSEGGSFTAYMDPTLALEEGYQYTFRIRLQRTPVTVSATIEPWKTGPTTYYDALQVSTPAGESDGVEPGDVMNVYLNEGSGYELLSPFTYQEDGTWTPPAPVYWENITANPAPMISTLVASERLNNTQLPDILISSELQVQRNRGANFILNHVASKVIVNLRSTTFSDSDLEGATITLPNYLTGGILSVTQFIPGSVRNNISVDRTDTDNGVALFQPQTIAQGESVVNVTINGRTYNGRATDGNTVFEAGVAYRLIVNVEKESTTVSATVVDWIPETLELGAVTVGTSVSGATGVLDGEQMLVYTGTSALRTLLSTYTYSASGNTFTPSPTVYWESLPDMTTFYATITRQNKYNDTQLDQILVASPVDVTASNGVNFTLSYPQSKVVVRLTSDGTFSAAELAAMEIILPGYATGATVNNGIFLPGTGTDDIIVEKGVGDNGQSAIAVIQPQTIQTGRTVVQLTDPSTGREYNAYYDSPVLFKAGVAHELVINLSKTGVTVSANVIDWEQGNTLNMLLNAISISGDLEDNDNFFQNKPIYIYELGNTITTRTYSYLNGDNGWQWSGPAWYWDNVQSFPLDLTAVYYPVNNVIPEVTNAQNSFVWNITDDQSNGFLRYDILMSRLTASSPQALNFDFSHVLSGVRLELKAGQGFTAAELQGATVQLNNFILDGYANLSAGTMVATGSPSDITPQTVTDGSIYRAIVMPQTINSGTQVMTIQLADYPNTPFSGTLGQQLVFRPGYYNIITVTLNKQGISLSATLRPWAEGDTGTITIQ